MSIKRKKMPNGKLTPTYYYDFKVDGKRFTGTTGCTTEREARKFEKNKVDELRKETSAKVLVEKYRDHLTGGRKILLEDVFREFIKKPRKYNTCERSMKTKETHWNDFFLFITDLYKNFKYLGDVTQKAAEDYIQFIRNNGKFNKKVFYSAPGKKKKIEYSLDENQQLSPRSCNAYHKTLIEICNKLFDDASLIENPFSKIEKWDNETESREPFTPEELKLIGSKADSFIYPIFAVGMSTGLREGDICTLQWSEVDFEKQIISRKLLKTGKRVRLPILPPLNGFLQELKNKETSSQYVLPEHADIYINNPTGIGYRVSKFLESINIETTKKIEGRTRSVSIKDVHSLRHSFCYLASIYGVPFNIVKSVVGHVDPRITEMYMDHANDEMKRQKLSQMPNFLGLPENETYVTLTPDHCNKCDMIIDKIKKMNKSNWNQIKTEILNL